MKNSAFLLIAVAIFILHSCTKDEEIGTINKASKLATEDNSLERIGKYPLGFEFSKIQADSIRKLSKGNRYYTFRQKQVNYKLAGGEFDISDPDIPEYGCLPPAIDCGLAMYPTSEVTNDVQNVFFDTNGDYIVNSFDNNYIEATEYFDESLVDDVISGEATVSFHESTENDDEWIIRFMDEVDELIFAYKFYDE